jgi:beta-galactosidase
MEKGAMEQAKNDRRILSIGGAKDSRISLKVADHKFIIGKEEFYPFVAEMHYFRIPKRHWSVCFERIRRAELRIISSAVPWNLHESRQGLFDFEGTTDPAKDLIVFLELCREFGFRIILKIGPWIGAEYDHGGLPDFALRHPETVATDAQGQPLMADPGGGAKPTPVPSYLSGRFQILLKNYYTALLDKIKNYVYPRGPVFMLELDHETSFGGHFDPFSGDYNPHGSLAAYPRFLEEKYTAIERVNKAYHIRVKDFGEVTPPTGFEGKSSEEYRKALDWIEFREWVVNRFAESVVEVLSQAEISVLFSRSLAFHRSYSFPDVAGARTGGRVIFTANLGWDVPFADTVRRARTVSGWQPSGYSTRLAVGHRHADPQAGHQFQPVDAADTKRLLIAALAGGIRGFNFHMFVGRPGWYDAALGADGAILPSYDVVRDAYAHLPKVRYEFMRDFASVALTQYRPYARMATLGAAGHYAYLADLVGVDFDDIADDMGALGHDYRIFDLTVGERLDEYKALVVPVGEFMDADSQERLLTLVKGGAHVILYGLLPKLDANLEPCEILAHGIGMKTATDAGIVALEALKQEFTVNALGVIKRAPTKAAKIAKSGTKLYGASTKCGKGTVTVLTFPPGSRMMPSKAAFLKDVLALGKLTSPVNSSDPAVHVVVHAHANGALLMVYDTSETTGASNSVSTNPDRPVIISLDIAEIGLAARNLTLADILGSQTLTVSPKDLKAGIEIRIAPGDSRLFAVEKKS